VSPPPSHSATGCEVAIGEEREEREERGERGGGALVLRRRACELYVSAKFTPCIIIIMIIVYRTYPRLSTVLSHALICIFCFSDGFAE